MNILELRKEKGITQNIAAQIVGMSRRGYQELEYRLDTSSRSYKAAFSLLENFNIIDEENGILTIKNIKESVTNIVSKYDVDYVILFGSYAREEAKEKSDIDLLISTKLKGLEFVGLVEELRNTLKKKVDLIRTDTLTGANELILDILKEGIRIYEKNKRL